MTEVRFSWSHGTAVVSTTAAMLTECIFQVDGRPFAPFATPWWGPDDFARLPGHLRVLGAEFVCVPFGEGGPLEGAVAEWEPLLDRPANSPGHGIPADAEWDVAEGRPDGLTLRLQLPEDHPIDAIERRIDGVPGEPTLRLQLVIWARRRSRTSLGLHPIVRLPDAPRSLAVEAEFDVGFTYPAPTPTDSPGEPTAPRIRCGQRFSALEAVPSTSGTEDLSRLPLERASEEIVQLAGVRRPVVLRFADEGASLEIDWDRSKLPSVQLWLSDRMLQGDPWRGRYRALGVEPIASAFDLAAEVSTSPNPISRAGFPTSVALEPGRPFLVDYRLRASAEK
ncbi:hypothetical protein QDR37_09115 [Amnibacterium sp. CER49]|uniref:hypothetical protein n=1 Tax=Amnibacterium sp. CER49 TaxID=3039161 RepID=UPI00244A4AA2|nr:hypothetical protein [Amnibacterium sp. CER49]MDH2444104.1 hypothetical protein [Amnibacterium sp. CER49]